LLHFGEGSGTAIEVFRDIFEDEVKVYFALLIGCQPFDHKREGMYPFASAEEVILEIHDVWMGD
jgi:hypothetical protein